MAIFLLRSISSSHRATNQQSPKKKNPGKWLQFKRGIRHTKDKIRNYIMDAFRNAKAIGELSKRMSALDQKVQQTFAISSKLEVDHRKSINFKLLLLLGLWILDKIVLFILFQWFNGQP